MILVENPRKWFYTQSTIARPAAILSAILEFQKSNLTVFHFLRVLIIFFLTAILNIWVQINLKLLVKVLLFVNVFKT